MFAQLFRSRLRKDLLVLLFLNPDQQYYIRQLQRLLDVSVGSLARELNKLESEGVLSSTRLGKSRFYRVNRDYHFYVQIGDMIANLAGVETLLKSALQAVADQIDYAFIFGSYAKGEFAADSDIDLYVIGEIGADRIYELVEPVGQKIQREINPHVAGKAEFVRQFAKSSFLANIVRDYLLLIGSRDEFEQFVAQLTC